MLHFLTPPPPPHVLMNFRGFPPGCGNSVADFWGWDAHEARLRCPDDVSGDMKEDEIPGGALSLNLLTTQTMVTTGITVTILHLRSALNAQTKPDKNSTQ